MLSHRIWTAILSLLSGISLARGFVPAVHVVGHIREGPTVPIPPRFSTVLNAAGSGKKRRRRRRKEEAPEKKTATETSPSPAVPAPEAIEGMAPQFDATEDGEEVSKEDLLLLKDVANFEFESDGPAPIGEPLPVPGHIALA